MQTIAMEFDSREHLNEAVEKLWVAGKVTGELAVRPLSGGRWRLDLTSEAPLKEKMFEQLPGKVLTGAAGGKGGSDGSAADEAEAADPEAAAAEQS